MKHEQMSDFEINKAVGKSLNIYIKIFDGKATRHWRNGAAGDFIYDVFDPCNNPSDAWPIIVDNGISIIKYDDTGDTWCADVMHPHPTSEYNSIEVEQANPLRAAMICFLMMKDAEK